MESVASAAMLWAFKGIEGQQADILCCFAL